MKIMIIKKVLERKDGVKMVIIPRSSEFRKGDYVKLIKLEDKDGRGKERS